MMAKFKLNSHCITSLHSLECCHYVVYGQSAVFKVMFNFDNSDNKSRK